MSRLRPILPAVLGLTILAALSAFREDPGGRGTYERHPGGSQRETPKSDEEQERVEEDRKGENDLELILNEKREGKGVMREKRMSEHEGNGELVSKGNKKRGMQFEGKAQGRTKDGTGSKKSKVTKEKAKANIQSILSLKKDRKKVNKYKKRRRNNKQKNKNIHIIGQKKGNTNGKVNASMKKDMKQECNLTQMTTKFALFSFLSSFGRARTISNHVSCS